MANLLYPQTYILSKCLEGLIRTGTKQTNSKPITKLSGVGTKDQMQNTVDIYRMGGTYRPGTLVNKIALPKLSGLALSRSFLNIDNHKLSALTPELKIYRVSDNRKNFFPFYFPVASDFNFDNAGRLQLDSTSFTGGAAAIESFSVNYIGNNPYDSGRMMLEATLSIKVDSVSFIFDAPAGHAPLVDLFLIRSLKGTTKPVGSKSQPSGALSSGKNVNIIASLGYAAPSNTEIFDANDIEAIRATNVLINLYYSQHNISLQQDGSATISVSYTGFLESSDSDSIWNILQTQEAKAEIARQVTDSETNQTTNIKTTKKQKKDKNKKKKNLKKIDPIDLSLNISPIFRSLYERNRIYGILLDPKDDFFLKEEAPEEEQEEKEPEISVKGPVVAESDSVPLDKPIDEKTAALKNSQTISKSSKRNAATGGASLFKDKYVYYVTFGDFLDSYFTLLYSNTDAIIQSAKSGLKDNSKPAEKEKANAMIKKAKEDLSFLKDMLICMGDIVFRRTKDDKEYRLNISDIPISVDTIYTLLYEEYIKPNKAMIGLREMLVKVSLDLLKSSFNQFAEANLIYPIDFSVTNVSGQDLSNKVNKNGIVDVDKVPTSSRTFSRTNKNYYIFHSVQNAASSPMGKGDPLQDEIDGIFHLNLNMNKGLVKNIQFSSMNVEGRQEYAMQGHGDAFDELRIPQNATVTMYGNSLFYPSMPIYINPDSIGFGDPRGRASAARRLGYGGYYTVLTINTTYQSGQLTTVLNTVWTSYPETVSQPKMSPGQQDAIQKQQKITEISRRR